ncbi:GNAT family N-acetyltransferase [Sulfurimonas sp. CVO]|uniref:GNAT family N-acyltransferase n=1 Tax=Sulfurimonas sp. CVO TaxID=2283483 RepID=UPI00132F28DD|nr:GNAT family N-acyltransferase [Sulfurimonas sp. CVO]QHG91101.1 GNAT family N-acetyltransferase [Sulfurimonas sp. CVO]
MKFTFLEVKESDILEKVFAFRYKILLEIYPQYLKKCNFSDTKEHDEYDKYSVHFAVLDENDEVSAAVRIIHNSPIGYPTENNMKFDNSMFERDKLGEMSRIFVDAKYRNIKTTKSIMQGLKQIIYNKMKELGLEYTYGSQEASFLRLLKMYKMNYHTIGEEQTCKDFGLRYPSIIYTEEFGEDNPDIAQLWKKEYEKK